MKNIISLFGIAIIVFCIYSCKSNPAEPPIITPVEVKPGSRDYTWDITTLQVKAGESAWLSEIWGSSPSDIWAIGSASMSYYGAWHFNGSTWQYGTTESTFSQNTIWGSSSNNIWMGNGDGILWKFNGTNWVYFTRLKLPEYNQFSIQHMWGVSSKEIYLIGAKINGVDPTEEIGIFKFNGTQWARINMPKVFKNGYNVYKDIDGDILFLSTEYGHGTMNLYSWNGAELKTLLTSNNSRLSLRRVGDKTIIIFDNKLYEYNNGNLKLLNDFSSTTGVFYSTCGRNEKDIFIGRYNGSARAIYHYNGSDIVEVYNLGTSLYPMQGIAFEKDVYIVLHDMNNGNPKILHGKLNE
jgi:hypothetical protein